MKLTGQKVLITGGSSGIGLELTRLLYPNGVDTPMTTGRGTRKMQPQVVAEAILQGVERKRAEIRIGPLPFLLWLNRLHPGAAAQLMRNS